MKIVKHSLPVLQCPQCGYKDRIEDLEDINSKKTFYCNEQKTISVIDKEEESKLRTLPTIKNICSKCGAAKSETWTVAVGSEGASSSLTFFRCTSCGYTRREAG